MVSRRQLLALGVRSHIIEHRVGAGRLSPVHRGVFMVGPIAGTRGREMAACLACGPSAVVSHRSAAALWELAAESSALVEITVRDGNPRERGGIQVYRAGTLESDEVTTLDELPITTPARTLLDLASVIGRRALERAVAEAFSRRLTGRDAVRALMRRHTRRPGSPILRAILANEAPALTRSEAEERFLRLVRRAQLRRPETNVELSGFEVDFLWRPEGLVAEIDGFAFHGSRRAFERDRRRDAELMAAGLRVVRITWRQLEQEPEAVLARLVRALAVGSPAAGGT